MQPTRPPRGRSPRLLPPLSELNAGASTSTGRYYYSQSPLLLEGIQPTRPPRGRSPRLLPPLSELNAGASTSTARYVSGGSRSPQIPSPTVWSYYHRGCVAREPEIWQPAAPDKRRSRPGRDSLNTEVESPPLIQNNRNGEGDEAIASLFLEHNRAFLNDYIMKYVSVGDIERWLVQKFSRSYITHTPVGSNALTRHDDSAPGKKELFLEMVSRLNEARSEQSMVQELARSVEAAVDADACLVFKLYPDHPEFVQYFCVDDEPVGLLRATEKQMILVREVAELGGTLRLSRSDRPDGFPDTPRQVYDTCKKEANHVLYVPLLLEDGTTSHVLELWKVQAPFNHENEATSSQFLVWGSLALHFCNLYLDKKRERNLSDFLLDVVKAIFEEMVSLDQLIKRILEFAQRLVNADRASLFLVDFRNFELVSTVFDLTVEQGSKDVEKKEIRMPINRGIAGHVALSGETMNIPDAYSDYRFNREVDEKTGYKTVSILCMPIKVQGKVIGVVQMVNKKNADNFHHDDEVAFEIFSTFFGLALHHARLYDRIMRKEQKYRVALEVLSYHNTCKETEVQALLADKEHTVANLNDFYLDPFKLIEFEKCKAVVTMMDDLFDLTNFDIVTVNRFILTVKKNYRTVPYHNFDHGWSVAHCMYVILKNDTKQRYSYKVRLALFVACLCHDLDHRGYTNKYMSESASPLAAMYSTSTLEHHHFNITVTILQQDGHNIFSHMSSEDYKEILGYIRQCILATDLAAFFPNLAKMKDLHEAEKFSWHHASHRDLAMAISMTSADLSAAAKPWEVQIKTVRVICEEFYDQGDKEREAGREPIPMMDRNKPEEQPASQVGFLSQICIPCYKLLYQILPKTKPMYVMALRNLHRWTIKAERVRNKENNEEDDDNTEWEEISEEVLLGEDTSTTEEDATDLKESDSSENTEKAKLAEFKKDNTSEFSWEDDESKLKNEELIGGRLSKDIEGVTWIDEEGVVVQPNDALPTLVKNSAENK
ncbi:3'5'-cyclic nucleotide phosphodiesterase domain-containing protein [Phthorimaea operculella]|nr:3'5'-cyclic nucleotide phosphodiesterase domain-containing protein [Phthorimaea operculella]